jgi:hypothetical protein
VIVYKLKSEEFGMKSIVLSALLMVICSSPVFAQNTNTVGTNCKRLDTINRPTVQRADTLLWGVKKNPNGFCVYYDTNLNPVYWVHLGGKMYAKIDRQMNFRVFRLTDDLLIPQNDEVGQQFYSRVSRRHARIFGPE